ncbi:MAG: hypothetical protein SFV54_02230 [Bryobacteraceae bacterium]|nr:hypothetical protein [Bryobacteraceae bacterium]
MKSLAELASHIAEDFRANHSDLIAPGFHAVVTYRIGAWRLRQSRPLQLLMLPVYAVMYLWVRNIYGIELPAGAVVGRRFLVAHQSGIVIHPRAVIGDDCIIRQNVTIGATGAGHWSDAPSIGNKVSVGAGATIVGKIRIGDGVFIGPNALVMTNVPAGSIVAAAPARIITRPAGTEGLSRRPTVESMSSFSN